MSIEYAIFCEACRTYAVIGKGAGGVESEALDYFIACHTGLGKRIHNCELLHTTIGFCEEECLYGFKLSDSNNYENKSNDYRFFSKLNPRINIIDSLHRDIKRLENDKVSLRKDLLNVGQALHNMTIEKNGLKNTLQILVEDKQLENQRLQDELDHLQNELKFCKECLPPQEEIV